MTHKHLIVVVGPTAVGKTDVCIQLAQHFKTVIVSADARQFYQGMAIGTAQPTAEQMQAIPHHFINFLPISADYSAGQFEKDAILQLNQLFQKYDCVILTGGAGLYIQTVCEGIADMPPVDKQIRDQLKQQLQQTGLKALQQALALSDPVYYKQVDLQNPQRLMRALEVCIATGKPYSSFNDQKKIQRPFQCIKMGLWRERPVLYARINQRVDQMLNRGLLAEVIALYPYRACNALKTVGYRELLDYLAGHHNLAEAIRLIKRNTRHYAKRQLTWFRRDTSMHWFHPDDLSGMMHYIHQQTSH